mmetsp:Transcript_47320/g.146250  ORF Transcript_47320/g.146250 Transcript_47320/m.146250 type:complete len:257 (-) Transcript_47320:41-811(-)
MQARLQDPMLILLARNPPQQQAPCALVEALLQCWARVSLENPLQLHLPQWQATTTLVEKLPPQCGPLTPAKFRPWLRAPPLCQAGGESQRQEICAPAGCPAHRADDPLLRRASHASMEIAHHWLTSHSVAENRSRQASILPVGDLLQQSPADYFQLQHPLQCQSLARGGHCQLWPAPGSSLPQVQPLRSPRRTHPSLPRSRQCLAGPLWHHVVQNPPSLGGLPPMAGCLPQHRCGHRLWPRPQPRKSGTLRLRKQP